MRRTRRSRSPSSTRSSSGCCRCSSTATSRACRTAGSIAWSSRRRASPKTFSSDRMVAEYLEQCYVPGAFRRRALKDNDRARLKSLVAWKQRLAEAWPGVRFESVEIQPDPTTLPLGAPDRRVRARAPRRARLLGGRGRALRGPDRARRDARVGNGRAPGGGGPGGRGRDLPHVAPQARRTRGSATRCASARFTSTSRTPTRPAWCSGGARAARLGGTRPPSADGGADPCGPPASFSIPTSLPGPLRHRRPGSRGRPLPGLGRRGGPDALADPPDRPDRRRLAVHVPLRVRRQPALDLARAARRGRIPAGRRARRTLPPLPRGPGRLRGRGPLEGRAAAALLGRTSRRTRRRRIAPSSRPSASRPSARAGSPTGPSTRR